MPGKLFVHTSIILFPSFMISLIDVVIILTAGRLLLALASSLIRLFTVMRWAHHIAFCAEKSERITNTCRTI